MNAIEIEDDGTAHISFSHGGKTLAGTMSFDVLYDTLFRMFAESELQAARAKVRELEERLGQKPPPRETPNVPRVVSKYEGTDAEFRAPSDEEEGSGGAADFRNELAELRARGAAKRARR